MAKDLPVFFLRVCQHLGLAAKPAEKNGYPEHPRHPPRRNTSQHVVIFMLTSINMLL
jgi:hypothetical protein